MQCKDSSVKPSLADRASERAAEPTAAEHSKDQIFCWTDAARIALVALAALVAWFRFGEPVSHINLVALIGVLIGGWPILKEAAVNIAARRMTMELSMSIAIIAAAAISEFFTALIITLFVLVAEVLESMTVSRGRRAIRDLLDFLPRSVTVRDADGVREASADQMVSGGGELHPSALAEPDVSLSTRPAPIVQPP
jgi:Cd2+/Zn2+-exporting ATPase/Cu+-exporting ATPase